MPHPSSSTPSLPWRVLRKVPPPVRTRLLRAAWATRPRATKVSVIIPAYNTPADGLARLLRSLDAQTLNTREFEVIVVDDGSTDDTRARFDRIASTRPHWRVHTIPNSGWSSRPRNVAIDLARGEYVFFVDHDDELFPDALEVCYEFGARNAADVVNPKEVRTKGWGWGWEIFRTTTPTASFTKPVPLFPFTPHKLYRTAFLREHHVRFPEGRRVLWEDIDFNVQLLHHHARIAVLGDRPVYHWVSTGLNSSTGYAADPEVYWPHVEHLLSNIDQALSADSRDLLLQQLQRRAIQPLGPRMLARSDPYNERSLRSAQTIAAAYVPASDDHLLTPAHRARLELIRRGDLTALHQLAELDDGVTAQAHATELRWEDGYLVLTAKATLVDAAGQPWPVHRIGNTWHRTLPGQLDQLVSESATNLSTVLGTTSFELSVRGRETRAVWPLAAEGRVRIEDAGNGTGRVVAQLTGRFDPLALEHRSPVRDTVWDLAARFNAFGVLAHRGIVTDRAVAALIDGRPVIAYTNRSGRLSVDVGCTLKAFAAFTAVPAAAASATVRAGKELPVVSVELGFPEVHCFGERPVAAELHVGSARLPATLSPARTAGSTTGARLVAEGHVPVGVHALRVTVAGRRGRTGLQLVVDEGGAAVREAAQEEPTDLPG